MTNTRWPNSLGFDYQALGGVQRDDWRTHGRCLVKLLHVITGLNVGGAETMLARLLESARMFPDIDGEVVSLMQPGAISARIAATGVPVHSLNMRAGIPSLSAAIRLISLARRIRPDLIMGWMHHGQLAASLAGVAVGGGTRVIWNVRHSLGGYRDEKALTRTLLRIGAWLSATPSVIVYNSRTAARQYRAFGFRPRREMVISNGFDIGAFRPRESARSAIGSMFDIPRDRLLIGMVARNHPMKDVTNLIAAFAKVREVRSEAHLLIAGDGMDTPSADAARMLASLPRSSWTLAGHRVDVPDWLAGLDLLALPSAWGEGFPNIVGEAMASGVPCVATDVGDAGWLIGDTGRLVPARDAVALGKALLELAMLAPAARDALGQAARARVNEHFALPAIADDYARLCREYGRLSPLRAATAGLACLGDRT